VGPPREGRLLHFAQWIRDSRGIAASSISTYISTVREIIAIRTGYHLVRTPLLERFLLRKRQRDPKGRITAPANKNLLRFIYDDPHTDMAVKTAALTAFNGLLRSREYCSPYVKLPQDPKKILRRLQRNDLRMEPDGSAFSIRVFGKSDSYNHGPDMHFCSQPGDARCIVQAMRRYLTWRDTAFAHELPLFIKRDGGFVTPDDITTAIKRHAKAAGLPAHQSGTHSLRYGGAFELIDNGAQWPDVIARGRWRSEDAKKLAMQYAGFSKARTTVVAARLSLAGNKSAESFRKVH